MTDRELQLHCARVYLAEAGRRRHHPQNKDFYWTLMSMVAACRCRFVAMREPSQAEPIRMIEVGDKVRHWSRGFMGCPEDDWMMFGSGIDAMTVVRVIELGGEDWKQEKGPSYVHVACALPPPYQQESHYCYFTLRSTRRPWQYRSNGSALHIVAKAPRAPQMDLFA